MIRRYLFVSMHIASDRGAQIARRLKFTFPVSAVRKNKTAVKIKRRKRAVIRWRNLSDGVKISGALSPLLEHGGRGVPRQRKG